MNQINLEINIKSLKFQQDQEWPLDIVKEYEYPFQLTITSKAIEDLGDLPDEDKIVHYLKELITPEYLRMVKQHKNPVTITDPVQKFVHFLEKKDENTTDKSEDVKD